MGRPRSAARRSWPDGLYLNGAGYFYWKDPADGKTYGLGTDKAAAFADARAANAKRAAEESKTLLERISTANSPTLAAWVDTWLTIISETLKPTTVKGYRSALQPIVGQYGHFAVPDITPKIIADILEACEKAGKQRMANLTRTVLLELFRMAEIKGHIAVGKNPVVPTKTARSKVRRGRLSLEQFRAIYACIRQPWAKWAMELALVTTQRRSDVAGMQRADLIDNHLQVDQRKSGGVVKLGIPLSLRLEAVGWNLRDIVAHCRTAGLITPHLLHHRIAGGRYAVGDPVAPASLSAAFNDARVRAGVGAEPGRTAPTFHEIRSLGVRLYKAQCGTEFAQALAGHKNVKTTLLYADPRDSEAKRIMIPDPSKARVSNE